MYYKDNEKQLIVQKGKDMASTILDSADRISLQELSRDILVQEDRIIRVLKKWNSGRNAVLRCIH